MLNDRQPFQQRIIIAFVLMSMVVSGLFSLGIVAVVHLTEEHLMSENMRRELVVILQDDLSRNLPPRLSANTRFYASGMAEYAIPEQFAHLEPGFNEVVMDDEAVYVYNLTHDGRQYLLVEDQTEFEAREQAFFTVVLAGFLLTCLAAWLLGRTMANKVMKPIRRLAHQVQYHDQLLADAPPLATSYVKDEIGQLAAALDRSFGQLRQSLKRERLFTSDVSHELRTPLMVITSSCELLQETPLDTEQRDLFERIQRATIEMRDLVQTFLQLARSEENRTALSADHSLRQVADMQMQHWRPLMEEKGLTLQMDCEGEDHGRYNPTLLRTVMANLLRNALHYTEQGRVRLVLESGGFRVEDTGSGVSEHHQEQIFQPFVRGPGARGEGLGLGLSLVRRIGEHQGWQISLEPMQPQGSCFHVRFNNDRPY